ncbi:amine sulfotransferase-like [Haemaphysalis longicornis]
MAATDSSTNQTQHQANEEASTNAVRDQDGSKMSIQNAVKQLQLGPTFTERYMQYTSSYQPRDGDVFLVSYPKCGSMWMQHILYGIFNSGITEVPTMEERQRAIPSMEFAMIEGAELGKPPLAIKTHLPFHLQPFSTKAKYIFITRNPYDCCVSYFYFVKSRPFSNLQEATFCHFVNMFLRGNVPFGDYFDHLLSWYKHRHDGNVLILTYESLKRDTSGKILDIADFLDQKRCGDHLRQNPQALDAVLDLSSFQKMKSRNADYNSWSSKLQKLQETANQEAEHTTGEVQGEVVEKRVLGDRTRKGIVGDWKNHFSPEQVTQMKERIALKTRGTDVMSLWAHDGLP